MTQPRRKPGRPRRTNPERPKRTYSLDLYDDQVDWLDGKITVALWSRSEVLRDLLDRLRAAEMAFGHTVVDPSSEAA